MAIPKQHEGNEVNIEHSVQCPNHDVAKSLFLDSAQRLLNVNQWHKLTKPMISVFQLTDSTGHTIFREAHEGDYFRINIPGPGTSAGNGYDWVRVESIDYEKTGDPTESISIRVRPVANPMDRRSGTAHFFTDEATSTFKVFRNGLTVAAGIYGRNEVPNTKSGTTLDKMRNAAVATGAIVGAANIQWQSLSRGLLGNVEGVK